MEPPAGSPAAQAPDVTHRPVAPGDAEACGRIVYEAFRHLAERHHFPPDFPSPEAAVGLVRMMAGHPAVFGVVAEHDGRVVGSNFLVEHDEIRGVGPITIDPAFQGRGVGRRLMRAVLDRGRGAAGIRLVQDAFNTRSMSLYASLGFDAREPLALVIGTPKGRPPAGVEVRPMRETDLAECAALCRHVHGIERNNELRGAIGHFGPVVLLRGGRVAAYASAPTFWPLNHGVAETDQDMRALLLGAARPAPADPLSFLLPIRRADVFRWCLGAGFRVVKPMTLMTIGQYQEPRAGAGYYPSVLY
jgi:GNAT superfamily N-acetyltransferase